MNHIKVNLRSLLLVFFMALLSFPGLNMLHPIIESGKLMGAITPAADTSFSPAAWWDGGYQRQKEKYINDHIGFHPDFVRMNNQLDFSLFKKTHAGGVVAGKDNYLYEDGYISAYYGQEYMGDGRIDSLMHELRYIQDTLGKTGTTLVLGFVPSKARYYPEYFPSYMVQQPTDKTNYQQMKKMGDSLGIHIIDLNGWFCSIKATTPHPLFSMQGIHWTHYGADHAADSLNRYLETLLHIDIPDMVFNGVECSSEPRGENDIAQGLNLIWPPAIEELCYDKLSFDDDSATKKKPSIIFIDDSFFWTLISNGIPQHCYNNWESWYYYNEIWDLNSISGRGDLRYVDKIDRIQDIHAHDALVLFMTEANLSRFKSTFIDDTYKRLGGK